MASPKMIRGLSITKNQRGKDTIDSQGSPDLKITGPDVRIKNMRVSEMKKNNIPAAKAGRTQI
jgi:hypothetical protein